jgi:hypothetical protein
MSQTYTSPVLDEHEYGEKSPYATQRDIGLVLTVRHQHVKQGCTQSDVARFNFLD